MLGVDPSAASPRSGNCVAGPDLLSIRKENLFYLFSQLSERGWLFQHSLLIGIKYGVADVTWTHLGQPALLLSQLPK
jgi:hypothetical protein